MAYFKINNNDFSMYVNALKIQKDNKYTAHTNAAGNTVVDFINSKREIEVGIIPLDSADMVSLTSALNAFNVTLSFRNPNTGALEEGVNCIIPSTNIEYYTIQTNNVKFNALKLKFIEL